MKASTLLQQTLKLFEFRHLCIGSNFKASHITSVGETIDVGLSRDCWFELQLSHFISLPFLPSLMAAKSDLISDGLNVSCNKAKPF